MNRISRRLEAFLYLGQKDNTFGGKNYQVTYTLHGHFRQQCLVHCVVEVIPGKCEGVECPICRVYDFTEEDVDGKMISLNKSVCFHSILSNDQKEREYVKKIVSKMYNKGKINLD